MTRLQDLGQRICILGPSSSGKSTLAAAIGDACGLEVVHLDLLHHLPQYRLGAAPEGGVRRHAR